LPDLATYRFDGTTRWPEPGPSGFDAVAVGERRRAAIERLGD